MNNDELRTVVLIVVIALSLLAVARPRSAPLSGTAAATLAALGAWFYGVTSTTATTPVKLFGVAGLVVTAAAAIWLAVATHRDKGQEQRGKWWPNRTLLATAASGIVLMLARPISVTPATAAVDYLKIAWVGLDVAEFTALVMLAYALRKALPWTAAVATITAALLSTDALINILPASGQDRLIALAMAFIELPLAICALAVAILLHHRGHLLDEPSHGSPVMPSTRHA